MRLGIKYVLEFFIIGYKRIFNEFFFSDFLLCDVFLRHLDSIGAERSFTKYECTNGAHYNSIPLAVNNAQKSKLKVIHKAKSRHSLRVREVPQVHFTPTPKITTTPSYNTPTCKTLSICIIFFAFLFKVLFCF